MKQFLLRLSGFILPIPAAFAASEPKSDPIVIYFENCAGTCIQFATGFVNYFTLTSGTNQAAIRAVGGNFLLLWGESDCDNGVTDLIVYFRDPNC